MFEHLLSNFRYPVEKVVHYPVKEYVDRPVPGELFAITSLSTNN